MPPIPYLLAALGLVLGAIMGLALLIRPRSAHLSIGLGSIPEKSGGVGESRAFGGLLLALHGAALFQLSYLMAFALDHDPATVSAYPFDHLLFFLAGGWLFAFLGRLLSVIVDREGLALNYRLLALDAAMTLLIAAPLMGRYVV
jgi:hypothetical protein